MACMGEEARGARERDAELRSRAVELEDAEEEEGPTPHASTEPPAVPMTATGLREIWQSTYGARVQERLPTLALALSPTLAEPRPQPQAQPCP